MSITVGNKPEALSTYDVYQATIHDNLIRIRALTYNITDGLRDMYVGITDTGINQAPVQQQQEPRSETIYAIIEDISNNVVKAVDKVAEIKSALG